MKRSIFFAGMILCVLLCGCGKTTEDVNNSSEIIEIEETKNIGTVGEIERICEEACAYASGDSFPVDQIIKDLGAEGYVAIDEKNKINMECSDLLSDFVKKAEAKESAVTQIVQVAYDRRILLYELSAEAGTVFVKKNHYHFTNPHLEDDGYAEFEATDFKCTEEGYLMISGTWHSPEMYAISLGEEGEHIAFRITPLDEKCRELCEKYIAPVSYEQNNMFITNWTSGNYGDLDFYDIFAKFYEETYATACPYQLDNDCIQTEFPVPAGEFEQVVTRHFLISGQELKGLLRFDADTSCYLYRPRGLYELDYCDVPYPEVVSYEENPDGSVTLTVNAVFPKDNTSKLFSHSVTVKETDGVIVYLSNQITGNTESSFWWHGQRLSEEVWQQYATEEK